MLGNKLPQYRQVLSLKSYLHVILNQRVLWLLLKRLVTLLDEVRSLSDGVKAIFLSQMA